MSADAMVDLDHGSHGALAETRDGAHRELAIWRGQQQFVRLVPLSVVIIESETQFQPSALQQTSRSARVARGAAANADRVLALGLQIE
jgi:hypothetical protein